MGYSYLEGWSLPDAAYMTLITLSTVGFAEVHELSTYGRYFTSALIVIGIGIFLLFINTFSEALTSKVENQYNFQKKMKEKIKALSEHYILCGYGRMGKAISDDFQKRNITHVIIDEAEIGVSGVKLNHQTFYIRGDATLDETLIEAGISQAKGLISAVSEDTANVYICLSATELRKDLVIYARFTSETSKGKLTRAGATHVINPYQMGSHRIINMIANPVFVKLYDTMRDSADEAPYFLEMRVDKKSQFIGKKLFDTEIRKKYNLIAISVQKLTGKVVYNPKKDYLIELGDLIIFVGEISAVKTFTKELNGSGIEWE